MLQFVFNIIFNFSIMGIVACSFYIYYKATNYFHVAHAVSILISAYAFYFLESIQNQLALSFFVSVLLAGMLGLIIHRLYGAIAESKSKGIFILVFSLGLLLVIENLLTIAFDESIKRTNLCGNCSAFLINNNFLSVTVGQIFIISIGAATILCCLIFWFYSKFGLYSRAISESRELTDILDMPVVKTLNHLAIASAMLAGIAGVLTVVDSGITPNSGLLILLPGIIAVIVGGMHSMLSTISGALFVSSVYASANYFIDSKWSHFVLYSLLIALLLIKPKGLLFLKLRGEEG